MLIKLKTKYDKNYQGIVNRWSMKNSYRKWVIHRLGEPAFSIDTNRYIAYWEYGFFAGDEGKYYLES